MFLCAVLAEAACEDFITTPFPLIESVLRKAVISALQLLFKCVQGKRLPKFLVKYIQVFVMLRIFHFLRNLIFYLYKQCHRAVLRIATFLCCLEEKKITEIIIHLGFISIFPVLNVAFLIYILII